MRRVADNLPQELRYVFGDSSLSFTPSLIKASFTEALRDVRAGIPISKIGAPELRTASEPGHYGNTINFSGWHRDSHELSEYATHYTTCNACDARGGGYIVMKITTPIVGPQAGILEFQEVKERDLSISGGRPENQRFSHLNDRPHQSIELNPTSSDPCQLRL